MKSCRGKSYSKRNQDLKPYVKDKSFDNNYLVFYDLLGFFWASSATRLKMTMPVCILAAGYPINLSLWNKISHV